MPDIYDRGKALAKRLLAPRSQGGKGAPLSVTHVERGEYDPSTGDTSGDVRTMYLGSAFRDSYNRNDIDGTLILVSDVKFLVSPVLLVSGGDMPAPQLGDDMLFEGTRYKVHNVKPWDNAGLVYGFEVQARL